MSEDAKDYVVRVIPVDDEPYMAVWHMPLHGQPGFWHSLKENVEQVTGDPMEHVRVFADFNGGVDYKYLDMFVNELGHMRGLDINVMATSLYQNNVKIHHPNTVVAGLPLVVGPAVLFEERVWQ